MLALASAGWLLFAGSGTEPPATGAARVVPANVLAYVHLSTDPSRPAVQAADQDLDSLHGFVLVRHGHVVAEGSWAPYAAGSPHMLFSLSKSFTSTAVGLAVAEGKLSIDDPVLSFFPDEAPAEPSANLKAMRISDLLRMNTGQQTEPPRRPSESWAKTFLGHAVPFKPGTHFLYNTSGTYMASAAVQQETKV